MENGWGARKVQAELEKLGFQVSLATVSRYLPRRRPSDTQRQRWTTFLRNHRDAIAAMDFFVIPAVRFELLDRVIVPEEQHLWRLLRAYVEYYKREGAHTRLRDSPSGRPIEYRPSPRAQVVELPSVGGLHHRYAWRDAA
jgi:hypothetical protein